MRLTWARVLPRSRRQSATRSRSRSLWPRRESRPPAHRFLVPADLQELVVRRVAALPQTSRASRWRPSPVRRPARRGGARAGRGRGAGARRTDRQRVELTPVRLGRLHLHSQGAAAGDPRCAGRGGHGSRGTRAPSGAGVRRPEQQVAQALEEASRPRAVAGLPTWRRLALAAPEDDPRGASDGWSWPSIAGDFQRSADLLGALERELPPGDLRARALLLLAETASGGRRVGGDSLLRRAGGGRGHGARTASPLPRIRRHVGRHGRRAQSGRGGPSVARSRWRAGRDPALLSLAAASSPGSACPSSSSSSEARAASADLGTSVVPAHMATNARHRARRELSVASLAACSARRVAADSPARQKSISASSSKARARRSPGGSSRSNAPSRSPARWKSPARWRCSASSSRRSAVRGSSWGASFSASSVRCAATSGAPRRRADRPALFERLRDRFVRAVRGEREVVGPLFGIGGRRRQRGVGLAPLRTRSRAVDGGGKQRMRELDPSVQADAHEPGLLGRRERLDVDQLDGRTGECRHPEECGPRLRRQRRQAPHDQLLQVGRDGERGAVVVRVVLRQQLRDLERVQRIAAGDLGDSHQRRPREAPAGAVGDHAVERRDRERSELQPAHLRGRARRCSATSVRSPT